MKLTKETLKRIIKEELDATLNEMENQGGLEVLEDFDAEVRKLRKSGKDDMQIAKIIAKRTGQEWDQLMYDIMMVK
jgi:hypothetical protein